MENKTCEYCFGEPTVVRKNKYGIEEICKKCHEHFEKQKYMEENPHEFYSCGVCEICIHIGGGDCLDKIHESEVEKLQERKEYLSSREYQERIALEIYGIILLTP